MASKPETKPALKSLKVSADLHSRLRKFVGERPLKIGEVVEQAIIAYLRRREKPGVD